MFNQLFYRLNDKVSAVASEEKVVESNDSGTGVFRLTYLEVGFQFLDLGSFFGLMDWELWLNCFILFDFRIRAIVGYGKWEVQKYWLIQSWWGTWILEFLGCMMLRRSFWRISRYNLFSCISVKVDNFRGLCSSNWNCDALKWCVI